MSIVPRGVAVVVLLLAGCAADPVPTPAPRAAVTQPAIPDDFPLLAGLPVDAPVEGDRYGPVGPGRDLDPLEPTMCGRSVRVPPHADLLRGGWSNVEDYRERQLTIFESADPASAYLDDLLDLYRSCPSSDAVEGHRTVVVDPGLGEESGAVSVLSTYDGAPRPGLQTVLVVRVGTAVLISTTSNEGGGGPDPYQQAAEHRVDDARALRDVVEAMAIFGDG